MAKPVVRTLRVANPHRRPKKFKARRRSKVRRHSRPNPNLLTLLSNPHKRGGESTMSKPKRRSRRGKMRLRASNPHRRRSSRRNPFFGFGKKRRHIRRRHSNPSIGGFDLMQLLKWGVGAAAGGVATRWATQLALGSRNSDGLGYAANAGMAVGLGWLTAKFSKDRNLGYAVAGGGLAALVMRIWSEKVSQTAPAAAAAAGASSMQGLGDLDFSTDGLGGLEGYVDTSFALPTVSQNVAGNYVVQGPSQLQLPSGQAAAGSQAPAQPVSRYGARWMTSASAA